VLVRRSALPRSGFLPWGSAGSPALALVSLLGLALFVWPFTGVALPAETATMALTIAALLALVLVGVGTHQLDNRRLALLATIAALDSGLRLALVNGVAGFSPIFFLILCAGYVYGSSFGFLAGSMSLLVSALATGGVGPWLPYEMFAAGWVGAAAGLLVAQSTSPPRRWRLLVLAAAGIALGYAYGAATDVYDWSVFYRGVPQLGWSPGLSAGEAVRHYVRFYVSTSLVWDSFRAAGNALMVLALGPAVVAAMARFKARFTLKIEPPDQIPSVPPPAAAAEV
jgi:energy-coupling factor transport system substrate-specific component